MIHRLAKTYGKLPSEILERGADDLAIDSMIAAAGMEQDNREADRAARKARQRFRSF